MRIRAVEPIPLRFPSPIGAYGSARGMTPARVTTLVRVETDEGLVGVGESFGPPPVVAAQVRELAPLFVGQDPFDRETLWTRAINGPYHYSRGGIYVSAISGVETACWDIMGKATGLPVAKLLGGWSRDSVPVYASTGYFTEDPARYRWLIEQAAGERFKRIKIKCGDGIADDLERIDLVFELAGPEAEVMVDLNGNYTADLALRLAAELEPRRVIWLEEPLAPEDLAGYQRLRDGTRVPLAAGEAEALRGGFRELITRRLIDFAQPDITSSGGIGEVKAIVQLAQTFGVRYSPHVWGGGVALAAALQLCASLPSYPHVDRDVAPVLFEYDRGPNALRDELLTEPVQVEGDRIVVPRGPGLGVEVNWETVERYRMNN